MCFQARHDGQNYVFALLTGYRDPPAGVSVISAPTFQHSFHIFLFVQTNFMLLWQFSFVIICIHVFGSRGGESSKKKVLILE